MTTTEAVVLRAVAYRDADLIVTLYTRTHGRLSALARSARRSKKRFGSALELFTVSRVELGDRRRGDLWTLRSAQVLTSHIDLALDVATLAHASYAIELVRELTPAEHAEPGVFELLPELFACLSSSGASPTVLRAFELRLLAIIGLAPVFDACVACGRTGDELARGAVVDPRRGGVICAVCAAQARGAGIRPLSEDARSVLVRAQRVESLADASGAEPVAGAAEARDTMLAIVLDHVGKPLRSLEFIAKVSGAARARHHDS